MKMVKVSDIFKKLQHTHWNPESYVYTQGCTYPKKSPKELSTLADLSLCKVGNEK